MYIIFKQYGGFFIVIAAIILCLLLLFKNELKTLSSLQNLDDYGMYRMSYSGDYGFDDLLIHNNIIKYDLQK